MSRPTDDLRAEHALVGAGLAVLRSIGTHVRGGGAFPARDAAQALRFLREFLVASHFRKENEVVWPALAMRSSGPTAAAVGALMRLQDEATELINSLVVLWEPVGELSDEERRGFADTIVALDAALGRIQETEEGLFRECDACVPLDDQLDWQKLFADFDGERGLEAAWARRLRELATTWS